MIEGVWFTTIGESPSAVANTIWAAHEEAGWTPKRLVVFRLLPSQPTVKVQDTLEHAYTEFVAWFSRFREAKSLSTELETIVCDEEDYKGYSAAFRIKVKQSGGCPRAIDITPGRKFASAIGLRIGIEENVDSIFYCHLLDGSYLNRPYPEIPRHVLRLVDFRREFI